MADDGVKCLSVPLFDTEIPVASPTSTYSSYDEPSGEKLRRYSHVLKAMQNICNYGVFLSCDLICVGGIFFFFNHCATKLNYLFLHACNDSIFQAQACFSTILS